ncbi:MAG TPA: hypothetical protein VGI78_12695 [Acetobacteraceae bacterium]|jgi:hypothetical protein
MLRRGSYASFRADFELLADLLLKGGLLLVIDDAAGAPAARVLIQPDADILLSVNRSSLVDPALSARIRDAQRVMSAWLASASRPLDAMWTFTHVVAAVVYLAIARQLVAGIQHWLVQTAVAMGIVLLGTLVAAIVRRVLLRWLLRHL